jgi:hypothetical protein
LSAARRLHGPGARRTALAVLVGHGLLLLALGQSLAPHRPPAAAPAPMLAWLQLRAAALPAPALQPRSDEPRMRRPPARPGRPGMAAERPAGPASPQPAPAAVQPVAAAGWVPPAAAAPPEAASRAPLDLRWRPAPDAAARAVDLVRQARDADPRPDAETRLTRALGTDTRLHEEDRGAVRRFRRGSGCVDTRATRESQINPFDGAAGRMPRLVEPC